MSDYNALFKCRLCGEIFAAGGTVSRKVAQRAAISASIGELSKELSPSLYDIHFCKDGGIGIADFLGFKKRGVQK